MIKINDASRDHAAADRLCSKEKAIIHSDSCVHAHTITPETDELRLQNKSKLTSLLHVRKRLLILISVQIFSTFNFESKMPLDQVFPLDQVRLCWCRATWDRILPAGLKTDQSWRAAERAELIKPIDYVSHIYPQGSSSSRTQQKGSNDVIYSFFIMGLLIMCLSNDNSD